MRAEPFYVAYKQRLQEFLCAQPGGLFLEVGAGTGDAAVACAPATVPRSWPVDCSSTMLAQARDRGLPHAVVADGHRLPFTAGQFDGAWADRVLQHVAEPARALDELLRVVRHGGRAALADPDYDTDLARRVLRFRADMSLRNGSLAHQHAGLHTDGRPGDNLGGVPHPVPAARALPGDGRTEVDAEHIGQLPRIT
ncbi:methyltransferase domain-containing protein [Streptomyces sp. NPDC048106]|uniref:methyltransferase domain-containing protein n=1 Tax=Streptomyces sp. NPDC048106 TaxID=3155750 RepID=UPI00345409B0